MSDPDLREMDNESLTAAARVVAMILRDTGRDADPEASANLLDELADRLDGAPHDGWIGPPEARQ